MRRLPLLFIGLMLLLTACSGASKRGEAAGRAFLAAWGDTAAMHQVVQGFDALRDDSLRWPWEVKAANRAFAAPLFADGRDSLFQAAHVIVLSPRELAQLKVPPMVDLLMKREFDTDSAADYLSLIHWLCYTLGYDRHAEVFDSTMQARSMSRCASMSRLRGLPLWALPWPTMPTSLMPTWPRSMSASTGCAQCTRPPISEPLKPHTTRPCVPRTEN